MSNFCLGERLTLVFGNRDIVAGMDASQTEESLDESKFAGDEEYHPFTNGNISLE